MGFQKNVHPLILIKVCNLQVGEQSSLSYIVPLIPLQWSWLHMCVAVDCHKNHITAVFNGEKVEERQFELPAGGATCPGSLAGNLLLQKGMLSRGFWFQVKGRLTNLNVFSGLMSLDRMVRMTAGEDCGKQDGDYLAWAKSSWELQGATRWTELLLEDLCRTDSSIQLFTTQRMESPQDCRQLCPKLNNLGRMASVETPIHFGDLKQRLRTVSNVLNKEVISVWLPIVRENEDWVDSYTGNKMSQPAWNPGYPEEDIKKSCAIFGAKSDGYVSWTCQQSGGSGGWFCSCQFPQHPFLTLRGLCKDSNIDQTYLPQNNPRTGRITYYGNVKTYTTFLKEDNQWKMRMSLYNTTALSDAVSKRFMLGKQQWMVEGDSKKCFKGKPYTAHLKLTGCKVGEFTCNDAQCIQMEERCNQVEILNSKCCKVCIFII